MHTYLELQKEKILDFAQYMYTFGEITYEQLQDTYYNQFIKKTLI